MLQPKTKEGYSLFFSIIMYSDPNVFIYCSCITENIFTRVIAHLLIVVVSMKTSLTVATHGYFF